MIRNLMFEVYLLISDFLVESLKANKRDRSVYNPVSLKKPHSFYEPQLIQHYKNYISATQPKTCFWLLSEKTFALDHF